MNVIDFLGRGWKYPISIENGKIAISEDEDSVRESILIILGTAKGERVMRPDFGCGINEVVFSLNNSQTAGLISIQIKEALLKWEKRIEVLDVNAYPDANEETRLNIYIEYMIKTTNSKNNLVYPFYLSR
jgi:phage baseplate assembly protein W